MKRFITFFCVLGVLLTMVSTAYAAGSVTYDGNARKFIFAPGTEESPTSLFENFQNVMPGDSLTQRITVKNDASNEVKVKIYLRSLGALEESAEFLSQLHMTVRVVSDPETAYIFDAPAHQTGGLSDWVLLGTLYSGGEVELEVTLDVPITLGDDYQNAIGYIDWEFMVEELPVEPTDPPPPQTGDTANLWLYIGLMFASLAAMIVLLLLSKRKKETAE